MYNILDIDGVDQAPVAQGGGRGDLIDGAARPDGPWWAATTISLNDTCGQIHIDYGRMRWYGIRANHVKTSAFAQLVGLGPKGDRHGLGSVGQVDLGRDGRQPPVDGRGRVQPDGERRDKAATWGAPFFHSVDQLVSDYMDRRRTRERIMVRTRTQGSRGSI